MWPSIRDRYFYSTENHRAGDEAQNGQWYGLPKDIGPTVIFYNKNTFKTAGIEIISVAEENLEDFNIGAIADAESGKFYGEFNFSDAVPSKGYFEDNGKKYFNNQIAMSWEEVRVVAALLAGATSAENDFGYHTEWWFSYGWSVGGDCIQYVEATADANLYDGGGYYDFTLVDDTKNFIVAEGKTFSVNGNDYAAGETISYQDKLTNEEALAGLNDKAATATYDASVLAAVTAGTLQELPSQREAFIEFVLLSTDTNVQIGTKYGYNVTPKPTSIGGDGAKAEEFLNGNIHMLVDGRWNVTQFRELAKFDWDVAPLPVYKQYDSNGNVLVKGKEAGHSGSVALAISATINATKYDVAWKFVEYLAGPEGQSAQSLTGFAIPSQMSIAKDETSGIFLNQKDASGNLLAPKNARVFIRAAMNESEGDWAYTETGNAWINGWAGLLNGDVRNGKMSFEAFLADSTFMATYTELKKISLKA
jgi:ABC-type glycerol-3-phosphate transport system substrate-binding protein